MNILHDREDAKECVSDTYLNTWNSIPPKRPSLLAPFLGRIVRNLSFNKYKSSHSLKRGGHELTLILDELSEIVSGEASVEDTVIRNAMLKAIDEFIFSLSREKRYVFLRRYWYSDSIADIADKCGRSVNSVTVELSRTRQSLRKYLTERGYDL